MHDHSRGDSSNSRAADGYVTRKVLKSTGHVQVELRVNGAGSAIVSKRYRAHTKEDQKRNASYSYMALCLFKERFSDVLSSPSPIFQGAENGEILMEYLPDLPVARQLRFHTLQAAKGFFERCYSDKSQSPMVETIYDSVMATTQLKNMINNGWPLRLGLKCDLFENLRYRNGKVLIADVEGLAYEPCGLSELVLHANLHATVDVLGRIRRNNNVVIPIAFGQLSMNESIELCSAATEVFYNSMKTVPLWMRPRKVRQVERAYRRAIDAYYSA